MNRSQEPLEMQLADADETYRSIFERSGVVKLLIDPAEATIVDANPAAANYYGVARTALRGQPVSAISATPAKRLGHDLARTVDAGTFHVVTRHRLASGEERDVEIYATAIRLEGRIVLYSIVHDVTERVRAERALGESENKHRELLSSIRSPVLSVRRDLTIYYCNEAYADLVGRPVEELEGQGLLELFPSFERTGSFAAYKRAMETNEIQFAEGWVRGIYLQVSVFPTSWGILALSEDATERRRAEQISHYQAGLLENVSDAVISTDLDYVVQSWNRAAELIYGWRADEVVGQTIRGLLRQEATPEALERAAQVLFDMGAWQGEVRQHRRDGEPVDIFSSVSLVRDGSGRPVGMVAVNRDVTTRKLVEEQLRQRIQLEQLVGQISADFISRPVEQIDAGIENALGALGRHTAADRAEVFLLQMAARPITLARSHSWASPAAPPSPPRRDVIAVDALPWARDVIARRQPIFVRQLNDLPAAASAERALLEAFGIHTIVGVPLKRQGQTIGLLTLESGKNAQIWDERARELLGFMGDILASALDRKSRELALRQSEERFRELVEATPVIPFELDVERLAFTYIGPQFERLLGFTAADWATPGFWLERVHPDDREPMRRRIREAASGQDAELETEFRARAWDERTRWFRGIVTLAEGGGERPLLRGYLLDITESRRAEEAYQQLVEHSLQGLIIFQEGSVVFANRAAARILGYSVAELKTLGLPFIMTRLLPLARGTEVSGRAGTQDPPVAAPIQTPQGDERWIELSTNAVELRGRPALQIMLVDVTARRQAEEALRQAQKMESLGVLAGGVAHDFNNLLVAMLGQASLARMKLEADDPAAGHIEKVVRAAERAADLTRQMLAYSGQGQFEMKALGLNQLIRENLHLFEVAMPKRVRLEAQLHEPLPSIEADTGQMQQVVMNLILNGAEAIGDHAGTVLVSTDVRELGPGVVGPTQFTGQPLAAGSYVVLSVVDDGGGMDPGTISRIFDPFFTTKFTGRGLGLAAVLGIVRGHRGGLTVDSVPGQGTTFRLYFPATTRPAASPPTPGAAAGEGARGLVLVIDDEESVREAVVEILDLDGWSCVTAADGEAGVALFQARAAEICLVLLDLSMPGRSGRETLADLRAIEPEVPVLLFSGYSRHEAVSHFADRMPSGFLQKPFSTEKLLRAVRAHARQ